MSAPVSLKPSLRSILTLLSYPFVWSYLAPWFLGLDPVAKSAVQTTSFWGAFGLIILFFSLSQWRRRSTIFTTSPYLLTRDYTALVMATAITLWAIHSANLAVAAEDAFALLGMHTAFGLAYAIPIYLSAKKQASSISLTSKNARPHITTAFVLNAATISLITVFVFGIGLPAHYQDHRDQQIFRHHQQLAQTLTHRLAHGNLTEVAPRLRLEARRIGLGGVELTAAGQQPRFLKNAAFIQRTDGYDFVVQQNGDRYRVFSHRINDDVAWFRSPARLSRPVTDLRTGSPVIILILILFAAPFATWLVASDLSRESAQITNTLKQLGNASVPWTHPIDPSTDLSRHPSVPIWSHDELGDLALDLNQVCQLFERTNQSLIDDLRYAASQERAQSRFLASASQLLDEPTAAIVSICDSLQHSGLTETLSEDVKAIQDATEKLALRIGDMELLSTLDDWRQLPFAMESFPIIPLAKSVFEHLSSLAPNHLNLEFSNCQGHPTIVGDKKRVRQVLENLIGNAIKFTEAGFVRVRIDHDTFDDGTPAIRIQVWDSGLGIRDSELDSIFAEFYRSQAHRNVPGSGIGLAIARRLVERHSGRLWAESRLGEGSIFHCLLPTTEDA